jgi:alpha-tubulin suppressor-like RCC1 family protein
VGGDNFYGETDVPTGLTGAVAIAAGTGFSLALLRDGTVVAWGYDAQGEIDLPTRLSGVAALSAGWSHSLELT